MLNDFTGFCCIAPGELVPRWEKDLAGGWAGGGGGGGKEEEAGVQGYPFGGCRGDHLQDQQRLLLLCPQSCL